MIKWMLMFLLPGIIFACSGTKGITQNSIENAENQEVELNEKELPLEEQKQMQFDYMFVEALKEKSLGNPQQAIQLLSGCLEINPNSSAAMYELATIHAENNDFASSSLLLEKAIQLNPDNKWYSLLLAQIYQQTQRFNDAAVIYDKLLQQEPENLEFLYMKAALLSNANKIQEAIDAYNKLEEKVGVNEQISVSKQQLYVENDEVEKAFGKLKN
jgi:tetratricopeptide (TPR) repeat protein